MSRIVNREVAEILRLVGIDPARVPSRDPVTAARHMELLVRYIGFRSGLAESALSRPGYDLSKPMPAILGDFIEKRLTFRPFDHMDTSLFTGMRRMLALVEGATGYPMTSERMEKKALLFFIHGVRNDILEMQAVHGCGTASYPDRLDAQAAPTDAPAP